MATQLPALIKVPSMTEGDMWRGITRIGPITINGEPPAEKLVRVRMQVWINGRLGATLDSDPEAPDRDAAIAVEDEDIWIVAIPECPLPLPEGVGDFDIEYYREGIPAPWTLHRGKLTVGKQITKPPVGGGEG